ncbi:MAG: TPM domain-containing protein [Alphaproteobacteria bacterium]|nr:TPM domain-containing protein [Alphaproteobacteria bacterium]
MRQNSTSTKRLTAALIVAILAVAGLSVVRELQAPPALVEDDAKLMTPEERAFVADFHRFLVKDHDIDYRVVTVDDAGDINRFAVEQFEKLFDKSSSATGRGLLLVVDPTQDRVRLEVSFALEGAFPDAFIAYVENRQMVPFFRTGRIADGILASTELIAIRAQRAADNAGFDDEPWATASGGGGAATTARIGDGPEQIPVPPSPAEAPPTNTPEQALQAYFAAMDARNASPDLAFYTPATREMLRGWTITQAQMDQVVDTYRGCTAQPIKSDPTSSLAVIRYPVAERSCAPFFFENIDGAWALDLTMMQRAIRFGRTNAWRFDQSIDHPYRFAFTDWRFDENGFPAGVQ